VLLLSDGLANAGETSEPAIIAAVTEMLARGVRTSTLGVGGDFDERLMTSIGVAGGGNAWFAGEAARIPELVQRELGEALEVVTRSARLVVDAPPGATVRCLHRFVTSTPTPSRTVVDLGSLTSRQLLELALEVQFTAAPLGTALPVRVTLEADGGAVASQVLDFVVASQVANDEHPRDRAVDRVVAQALAAEARIDAVDRNREGKLRQARERLEQAAERIARRAGGDRELSALVRALRHEAGELSEQRTSMDLKQRYYQSQATAKGRDVLTQGSRRR
jgi:Ca-activated chloride channel family protein